VVIARTQTTLATRARIARSLPERLIGLLDRSHFAPGEALVILSCRSIHTCFMRFAIDAVFVDGTWGVVAIRASLPPWRLTPVMWGAQAVIELPAGTVEQAHVRLGDRLRLEPSAVRKPLDSA